MPQVSSSWTIGVHIFQFHLSGMCMSACARPENEKLLDLIENLSFVCSVEHISGPPPFLLCSLHFTSTVIQGEVITEI